MVKKILVIMVSVCLITGIAYGKAVIDFEHYQIEKLKTAPREYQTELNNLKARKGPNPEANWRISLNKAIDLVGEVVGVKDDPDVGEYKISNLYVVISGKKLFIEKECLSFGDVSWDKTGTKIIYQKLKSPGVDFTYGELYLVTVDTANKNIEKRKMIDKIGFTNIGWSKENEMVAFSDFYAVYIYDLENNKLKRIIGNWASEFKNYELGMGYPHWCGSFVWLNQDHDLYFAYQWNVSGPEIYEYYKIAF